MPKTTTFIGGLRLTAMTAPMVLDGPMTGNWFAVYARQVLLPTLKPGDILASGKRSTGSFSDPLQLDNLPAHRMSTLGPKSNSCRPHSPDFNPIEIAFGKLKHLMRKAVERTVDDLWHDIAKAIFTPTQCRNMFAAAGYDAT